MRILFSNFYSLASKVTIKECRYLSHLFTYEMQMHVECRKKNERIQIFFNQKLWIYFFLSRQYLSLLLILNEIYVVLVWLKCTANKTEVRIVFRRNFEISNKTKRDENEYITVKVHIFWEGHNFFEISTAVIKKNKSTGWISFWKLRSHFLRLHFHNFFKFLNVLTNLRCCTLIFSWKSCENACIKIELFEKCF